MSYSRDTFYRYQAARDKGGLEALLDKSSRKPKLKNRVDEHIERQVVAYATDFSAYGQMWANN